jgi:NAD(P)H-flavin reductase
MAARHFQPGQFYRLQNYDSFAERPSGFHLTMEGIALTGAWVDRDRGLVSLIVLEMGGSSRLCALLNPGEPVVLMGPTGTPTEIPENETVLLAGGGLGNAVLFSIAEALKEKNNRVIYFAGYRRIGDLFKRREIESLRSCGLVVDEGDMIEPAAHKTGRSVATSCKPCTVTPAVNSARFRFHFATWIASCHRL